MPIFPAHQRLLRFVVEQHHYQFGLATTPLVFTRILAPLLAKLRAQGETIMAYLDDLLLVDQLIPSLNQAVCSTVKYLESLGWVLNWEKSALQPVKRLEYLVLVIDADQQFFFLPQAKVISLRSR